MGRFIVAVSSCISNISSHPSYLKNESDLDVTFNRVLCKETNCNDSAEALEIFRAKPCVRDQVSIFSGARAEHQPQVSMDV